MKNELKPCPFCGGKSRLMYLLDDAQEVVIDSEEELDDETISTWVHCENCSSDWFYGESEIPRDTLKAWNRRVSDAVSD